MCAAANFQKGFLDGKRSMLNQAGHTTVRNLKMSLMKRGGRGPGFLQQKEGHFKM